ncbi:conserved hypothetical protein [Cupriavidus taiwanensis]|uniref:Uncharacterized protein n=1 Tax=Cupriavidus taiwanensis TaxID=164546 RepID=A0A375J9F5_9BURK|nr:MULTISPECIES: hypothetical protein [Cupriavidus]PVY76719.1 hypothetical protein C7414_109202 [Cupriavidus alkaliphilus]SCB27669.1 hypothetical protein GA0116996_10951 [Cupriavidus alkaliphilus]SOZ17647.1 conserved hypothetical protein [Cupriavidus taiwanensis]SOZ30080.1 conserved hypothetical protein [Cupriavidus taiwanensis]SOZ47067.1 conserved hypothetical protein [Cupriavidus taiwanensis]
MERLTKSLSELKHLINLCLRQEPGCQDCQLRAVCVHRPDHTGCNWSAEVDFPERSEADAVRHWRQARRVVMMVREQYNVGTAAQA